MSSLTLEDLAPLFSLSFVDASKKLSVCQTSLKKVCRRLGLARWPQRRLRHVDKRLAAVRAELAYTPKDAHLRRALEDLEAERASLFVGRLDVAQRAAAPRGGGGASAASSRTPRKAAAERKRWVDDSDGEEEEDEELDVSRSASPVGGLDMLTSAAESVAFLRRASLSHSNNSNKASPLPHAVRSSDAVVGQQQQPQQAAMMWLPAQQQQQQQQQQAFMALAMMQQQQQQLQAQQQQLIFLQRMAQIQQQQVEDAASQKETPRASVADVASLAAKNSNNNIGVSTQQQQAQHSPSSQQQPQDPQQQQVLANHYLQMMLQMQQQQQQQQQQLLLAQPQPQQPQQQQQQPQPQQQPQSGWFGAGGGVLAGGFPLPAMTTSATTPKPMLLRPCLDVLDGQQHNIMNMSMNALSSPATSMSMATTPAEWGGCFGGGGGAFPVPSPQAGFAVAATTQTTMWGQQQQQPAGLPWM